MSVVYANTYQGSMHICDIVMHENRKTLTENYRDTTIY